MARCPFATWRPLPENAYQDPIDPDQVILHTAVDAEGRTSLFGYFGQEEVTLESTFYVRMDGEIEQYLDTNVRADANFHANPRAISIETEDDGRPDITPWTAAQIVSLVRLIDWLCTVHPKILRRRCPAWDQAGIGYHTMWGAPSPWTPVEGKTCPGAARIPQVDGIIRAVANPTPIVDEDELMTPEMDARLDAIDHLLAVVVNSLEGNDARLQELGRQRSSIRNLMKDLLDEQSLTDAVRAAVASVPGSTDPQAIAEAVLAELKARI
jgi:hypothetical protein